jgi:hypothetical protein
MSRACPVPSRKIVTTVHDDDDDVHDDDDDDVHEKVQLNAFITSLRSELLSWLSCFTIKL